jgi:DNA polymerase (family 10)
MPRQIEEMVEDGHDLTKLPGLGKDLAGKVREIVSSGTLNQLETLKGRVPERLIEVMQIAGIGAKRAKALWEALGITTPAELQRLLQRG